MKQNNLTPAFRFKSGSTQQNMLVTFDNLISTESFTGPTKNVKVSDDHTDMSKYATPEIYHQFNYSRDKLSSIVDEVMERV